MDFIRHSTEKDFSVSESSLIPMTHAPETGAINRLHFLRPVSCVSCKSIGPDSSGTRFRRRLFQARKWRARDWNDHLWILWFILFQLTYDYNARYNNSGHLRECIVHVAFSRVFFLNFCRQKVSFQTYLVRKTGAENRRHAENGVHLWRRFLERVPWVVTLWVDFILNRILCECSVLGFKSCQYRSQRKSWHCYKVSSIHFHYVYTKPVQPVTYLIRRVSRFCFQKMAGHLE